MATSPYCSVLQQVTGAGPAPCALRVRDGETELDPDYKVELAELTAGRVAGGLAPAGKGALFFRAFEPDVEIAADSDVSAVCSDAVWTWQRWDLATNEIVRGDGLAAISGGRPDLRSGRPCVRSRC